MSLYFFSRNKNHSCPTFTVICDVIHRSDQIRIYFFESCLYACIFNTRLLLCDINWKRYLSKISRNMHKTSMGPTWDIYIYKGLFLHNSLKGTLSHYEPLIRIPKMISNDYANLLLCSLYVRLRNWREKGKKAIRYFCIRIPHLRHSLKPKRTVPPMGFQCKLYR